MAFEDVKRTWVDTYPKRIPQRYRDLDAFDRLLDGTVYGDGIHPGGLKYPFHIEEQQNGDYIPLIERRPAMRYNLAKIVADETASLTYGEGHGPHVKVYEPFPEDNDSDDSSSGPAENTQHQRLEQVVKYLRHVTKLDAVMFEGMEKGSSGSVGFVLRVREDKTPWVSVIRGKEGTPKFSERDPERVEELEWLYPTDGEQLLLLGYEKSQLTNFKPETRYWIRIILDEVKEQYYLPLNDREFDRLGQPKDENPQQVYAWVEDAARRYPYDWGFCPVVWGRNLHERERVDGPALYGDIVDIQVEIDYMLSQMGRGFKYSMDPLMAEEPGDVRTGISPGVSQGSRAITRTPSRLVQATPGGKLKMLEITGQGLSAAREHLKTLREWALEVVGGMKSDQENVGGPQSGRALELLHQALVWLVGRMRIDYGDGVMVPLIRMMLIGLRSGTIELYECEKEYIPAEVSRMTFSLTWPSWWQPRGSDLNDTLQAIQLSVGGSVAEPVPILPIKVGMLLAAEACGLPDPGRASEDAFDDYTKVTEARAGMKQQELDIKKTAAEKPAPKPTGKK